MTPPTTFEGTTGAREWSITAETPAPDLMTVLSDAIDAARARQSDDRSQERVAEVMTWLLDDASLDWVAVERARDRWT